MPKDSNRLNWLATVSRMKASMSYTAAIWSDVDRYCIKEEEEEEEKGEVIDREYENRHWNPSVDTILRRLLSIVLYCGREDLAAYLGSLLRSWITRVCDNVCQSTSSSSNLVEKAKMNSRHVLSKHITTLQKELRQGNVSLLSLMGDHCIFWPNIGSSMRVLVCIRAFTAHKAIGMAIQL